jgi:hypothetical protein
VLKVRNSKRPRRRANAVIPRPDREGAWAINDHAAVRPVPPGSTLQRELLSAIAAALTPPPPATGKDELTYLRISRDRASHVLCPCNPLLADREADDRDVMIAVGTLHREMTQVPADDYDYNPLEF